MHTQPRGALGRVFFCAAAERLAGAAAGGGVGGKNGLEGQRL